MNNDRDYPDILNADLIDMIKNLQGKSREELICRVRDLVAWRRHRYSDYTENTAAFSAVFYWTLVGLELRSR